MVLILISWRALVKGSPGLGHAKPSGRGHMDLGKLDTAESQVREAGLRGRFLATLGCRKPGSVYKGICLLGCHLSC